LYIIFIFSFSVFHLVKSIVSSLKVLSKASVSQTNDFLSSFNSFKKLNLSGIHKIISSLTSLIFSNDLTNHKLLSSLINNSDLELSIQLNSISLCFISIHLAKAK